ncbi:MAG TPA: response regulator [Thermoanaerobaculia bacterium]|jgi:DNA-binding response OmpR family regulator
MAEVAGRVLIAEGDEELRRRLYSRLLDLDVFSDSVTRNRHAIEHLDERSYAVVVLDPNLGDGDCLQVLERIRNIPLKERPVVIVTAASPAAYGLNSDAVHIVVRKPYSVNQVADLVHSCVRRAVASSPNAPAAPSSKKSDQAEG